MKKTFRLTLAAFFLIAITPALLAQWAPANPVTAVQQQADGALLTMQHGTLKLQVCSGSIIHVLYSATASFPNRPKYVITKTTWPTPQFSMQSTDNNVTVTTSQLKVVIDRKDGAITYRDSAGKQLVQEGSRKLIPVTVNGEDTYRAESFINIYGSHEGLYGLGQHQGGVWNYRGESVDISQDNTNIAVPFLVSSNGYGIFWNNDSRSRFNNRFANYMYISSEVADVVDYYFFYGPELDQVISQLSRTHRTGPDVRQVGLRVLAMQESHTNRRKRLLGVAKKYRDLHIPVDNIVQDWFWWNRKGEHVFNKNYPDPKGMVDRASPGKLPPDDFSLALLRARLRCVRRHGQARLVRRQI